MSLLLLLFFYRKGRPYDANCPNRIRKEHCHEEACVGTGVHAGH